MISDTAHAASPPAPSPPVWGFGFDIYQFPLVIVYIFVSFHFSVIHESDHAASPLGTPPLLSFVFLQGFVGCRV